MLILLPGESEKAPSVPPKDSAAQPVPEELPPPPYSPPAPQAGPSSPGLSQPEPQRPFGSAFAPQTVQTVNHFELFSKHNPIAGTHMFMHSPCSRSSSRHISTGTYLVDPLLPTPGITAGGLRKLRKKRGRAWGKSACPDDIHASFRTRHAAINLDLAAVAESESSSRTPAGVKVPTCIVVSSRHGRVNLNLFEIQPGRSIDLSVETRHSKIVLLVPPTYDGPLMFQTRYAGSVTFLPEFAARTRTLRATDRETLVVCTPPSNSGTPSMPTHSLDTDAGDRVLARTRHGRIIVGISGLDRIEDAAVNASLFQKLGELFEVGGKLLGRYVEGHASALERKLTEKSALLTRALDDMKANAPDDKAASGNK
ncbi:hypothetical protein C8Q73DRAFT_539090 [Cubamyces lactineus]|nr:hypothetical protein C8Q73DRAFT_539090 [Cubamyces lactineus]